MNFFSTRGSSEPATLSQAIESGMAPDGGLYVPERIPFSALELFHPHSQAQESLAETAQRVLQPFFEADRLEPLLGEICAAALNFPIPLKFLSDSNETAVLELFHGPTAAFKDVGARFLSECFSRIPARKTRTVLVATSGDTGGAVAAAFYRKPGIEVIILFPKNGVSPLQEKQLTCWGDNIRSFAVRGSFDDCQRLVKAAFASRSLDTGKHLTSANSISLGRLLPQSVYYASSSLEYFRKTGKKPGYIIPSGNVGNAMAALWAMRMGFPIREIVMATNANRVVPDYFSKGVFEAKPSLKTLANAMDVGNPSNFERVTYLFGGATGLAELRKSARAISVSDSQIESTIRSEFNKHGNIWCPHTATAAFARQQESSPHWIIVATAHPAKFNDVIEPLLGQVAPMPDQLAQLIQKPSQFEELEASDEVLTDLLASSTLKSANRVITKEGF